MIISLVLGTPDESAGRKEPIPLSPPELQSAFGDHAFQCAMAQSTQIYPAARRVFGRWHGNRSGCVGSTSSRLIKQDFQSHDERAGGTIIPFVGEMQLRS